jgi:hypothetical protein
VKDLILKSLRTVRELLSDPRRWVQGGWSAHRDGRGVVHRPDPDAGKPSNCWCLGQAINNAVFMNGGPGAAVRFTDLRTAVDRELALTLGDEALVIYQWNDRPKTSHAAVLRVLDETVARLEAA